VLKEYENYNLIIQGMLNAEIKSAEANPKAESKFLKKPFLEDCQRAGLFDAMTNQE
jgi:hypothetical protein